MATATDKAAGGQRKKMRAVTAVGDDMVARLNWQRYQYTRTSGHDTYINDALRNEDYYLGGGLQWSESDRARMRAERRFMAELNHVLPAVNTATGLQLHSRVDMSFLPRGGGADENRAETLSKVVRQVCDAVEYQWKESQAYEDGLIQQRGYLELRIDFSRNFQGEIVCELPDPLDVRPDPDANSYDPQDWADVTITRWLTADEIEERYGSDKIDELHDLADAWFEDDEYGRRNHFGPDADAGESNDWNGWVRQDDEDDKATRRFLIIDRQHRRLVQGEVIVYYTGEIRPIALMTEQQVSEALQRGIKTNTKHRRIRWSVTCGRTVLHDDWSPYASYTIVPYFPIFRRGRTRGMVDNLRSPQDVENKAVSTEIEIGTKTANAGWVVWEDSLANMQPEDLELHGSKNGLVLVVRKGFDKPEKIQMGQVPLGISKIAEKAEFAIKTISGMSDALQGQRGNEVSGVAIKSKQYMGQTQIGRHLDNLQYTRRLVARKLVELVQHYYTEERVFRITDPETGEVKEELAVNQEQPDGSILNDLTIGRYDVVVTDTPTNATYEEGQFGQMMEMVHEGIPIPPAYVVKASSLKDKHAIAKELSAPAQPDPSLEAKADDLRASAELKRAQVEKVKGETVNTLIDAQYSSVQTAGTIAMNPYASPLADQLLRSAGYIDQDSPPIFPQPGGPQGDYPQGTQYVDQAGGQGLIGLPPNTNPTTPVPVPQTGSPAVGANQGIETQSIDGL
jgi:hypothetical protein